LSVRREQEQEGTRTFKVVCYGNTARQGIPIRAILEAIPVRYSEQAFAEFLRRKEACFFLNFVKFFSEYCKPLKTKCPERFQEIKYLTLNKIKLLFMIGLLFYPIRTNFSGK
jgi:hypothetical protein